MKKLLYFLTFAALVAIFSNDGRAQSLPNPCYVLVTSSPFFPSSLSLSLVPCSLLYGKTGPPGPQGIQGIQGPPGICGGCSGNTINGVVVATTITPYVAIYAAPGLQLVAGYVNATYNPALEVQNILCTQ